MDLKQRLKEIYDEGTISPYDAANMVIYEIPPEEYPEILRLILPVYAREILRTRRTILRRRQGEERKVLAPSKDYSLFVPSKGWVSFMSLSPEDCEEVAQTYEDRVTENQSQADYFLELARQMREQGVRSIGSLEEFRSEMARLTKEGLARARESGVTLGRPPMIPEETAEEIVASYKGGRSMKDIADDLNKRGVPTAHNGKSWHPSTIGQLLRARKVKSRPSGFKTNNNRGREKESV